MSLLEILQVHADVFVMLMSTMQVIESTLLTIAKLPAIDTDKFIKYRNSLKEPLDGIFAECRQLELDGSLRLINIIMNNLPNLEASGLTANIATLREMIWAELGDRFVLHIPQQRLIWFNNANSFGPETVIAFRKAIPDIKESGNCYSLGLYTACVFHLMRVLEHGLSALTKDVGLKFYRQSWGTIIDKIREKIDDEIKLLNKQPKDPSRTDRLTFLSQAAKEFVYFKDGWRNYAMHGLEEYDAPKALSVLNHVKEFMAHLATKLTE